MIPNKLIQISIKLTSEKNIDKLLELIVESAIELLNAERSTVFLFNEGKKELHIKVGRGVNQK